LVSHRLIWKSQKGKINHINTEIKEHEIAQKEEIKQVQGNYKTVNDKLDFLEKYIKLSASIEKKEDRQKLLNFLESMKLEKIQKARVEEHQQEQEEKRQFK